MLYYGHAVAAVAATSLHIAEEALELIRVTYEVLPPVLDVERPWQTDAPILLEDLRTDELGAKGDRPSNVAATTRPARGDVEQGFREAAVIVEREFHTATVHQGYIEPQNATALYSQDGQLTIWCSTQGAFGVRDQLADLLEIPVAQIRVIPMEIGGGFGGKNNVYLEPVAALLSKKSGHKPVKLTMSHAEVLAATGPTSGSSIRVKLGARKDGRITAAQASLAYEAGAFPGSPVTSGMNVIFDPYCLENVLIDGYDVVVNKPQAAAYRAPGGTNAAFACETVIDELAEKLGMDPLEFRLLNAAKEGDRKADGVAYAAHRLRGGARGGQEPPALLGAARSGIKCPDREARARRGGRGLGQLRRQIQRIGQRQLPTARQPGGRLGGYRRLARLDRHAAGRNAGHPDGSHPPAGGRHRLGRLHRGHLRQPHDLCHRLGGVRAGQAPDRAAARARRPGLGGGAGAGELRGRRLHLTARTA